MSIVTDTTPVEAVKDPESSAIYTLYKLFASPEQQVALANRYRAGGMGYGEAKQALFEAANAHFADTRLRREKLGADPDTLEDILRAGAKKARVKAAEVLDRVRKACGLPGQRN